MAIFFFHSVCFSNKSIPELSMILYKTIVIQQQNKCDNVYIDKQSTYYTVKVLLLIILNHTPFRF